MTEQLHFHFSLSCIGEGNGNPLQCSCLENPRDGGAWWAAVCGVTQSWTRLEQLSSSSSRVVQFDEGRKISNFQFSLSTFSIGPSNEYSGLISFQIYWFDLLAVQGILKSLLQPFWLTQEKPFQTQRCQG